MVMETSGGSRIIIDCKEDRPGPFLMLGSLSEKQVRNIALIETTTSDAVKMEKALRLKYGRRAVDKTISVI